MNKVIGILFVLLLVSYVIVNDYDNPKMDITSKDGESITTTKDIVVLLNGSKVSSKVVPDIMSFKIIGNNEGLFSWTHNGVIIPSQVFLSRPEAEEDLLGFLQFKVEKDHIKNLKWIELQKEIVK